MDFRTIDNFFFVHAQFLFSASTCIYKNMRLWSEIFFVFAPGNNAIR